MESYYKQNKKLITDILDILEGHFGKNVEFVVHDLSLDYEHTIVDIRNGEVTGRKVGGTGDGHRFAPVFAFVLGTDHRDVTRRIVVGESGIVVAVCK